MSHLEPPEPKGVHPQVEEAIVKMERKYKTESEIEEEMTNRVENLSKDMKNMKEVLRVFKENEGKVKMENKEKGEDKKESKNKEKMTNAVKKNMKEDGEVVDMRYMNEAEPKMMMISEHTTKSVVSRQWIDGYIEDMELDVNDISVVSCNTRCRIGKTTYLSELMMKFPVVLKTDEGDYVTRDVTANVLDAV